MSERLRIELTDKEVKFANDLANMRESDWKKNIPTNVRMRKENDSHYIGALGEVAFSKHSGLEVDTWISEKEGDKGVDFCYNDVTIDVKSTTWFPPYLREHSVEDLVADVYVLAYIPKNFQNAVYLCGWRSKEDFRDMHKVKDFRYGNKIYLTEKQLCPMNPNWQT